MNSNYWESFYKNFDQLTPSDFCKFVLDRFENESITKVLDAGCGNGRDTYALGSKYNAVGVDTSSYLPLENGRCTFFTSDFCTYDKDDFDMIYSRFTFHSITNNQHSTFLESIEKPGTYLCIECRSSKDEHTEKVHGSDHYRNFINKNYLETLLKSKGFVINYIEEDTGFSPYKGEDPVCIRVICIKE